MCKRAGSEGQSRMIPLFEPLSDPGPSFTGLLASLPNCSIFPPHLSEQAGGVRPDKAGIPHGTTVVALRHAEGVVLAGDRRATAGGFISHRNIEKVFPSGSHAGVAVAGAAGPSLELVRLFQLQTEHYEKVEGKPLSLEGQANQLGQMVRANLPAALTGLVAIPIFAGFDAAADRGRLFQYDLTGGRYEEQDYAATGSGSLHAGTVIKLGFSDDMPPGEAIDLAIKALFEAADEDSATGGPDLVRRIFPVIASIGADGYLRISDDEIESRFRSHIALLDEKAQ